LKNCGARLLVAHRHCRQADPGVGQLAHRHREARALGEALDRRAGDQDGIGGRELEQWQQVLDLRDAFDLDVRGTDGGRGERLRAVASEQIDDADGLAGERRLRRAGGGCRGAGHHQEIRLPLLTAPHAQQSRLGLRLLEQRRDRDDRIGVPGGDAVLKVAQAAEHRDRQPGQLLLQRLLERARLDVQLQEHEQRRARIVGARPQGHGQRQARQQRQRQPRPHDRATERVR
jgi:hypothetical protein